MFTKIVKEGKRFALKTDMGIGWAYEANLNGKITFDTRDEAQDYCERHGLTLLNGRVKAGGKR